MQALDCALWLKCRWCGNVTQALKYARAAAAVQACSYTIDSTLQSGDLPYVGDAIVAQIRDIYKMGTCTQLEQMRYAYRVRQQLH